MSKSDNSNCRKMVLKEAYTNFKRFNIKASNYFNSLAIISNKSTFIANSNNDTNDDSVFTCSLSPIKAIDSNLKHNPLFIRDLGNIFCFE